MAVVLTRDFNGGTAGSSAAAEFTATTGTAPVYHVASAVEGGMGVRFVGSATVSRGDFNSLSTTSLAWFSFYLTVESSAPANIVIAVWRNGSTNVGDLRMNSGATSLTIRNNTTAITGGTTGNLGVGTHRISIRCTPNSATGHEMRVYIGSNRDGTTPDFTVTGSATAAAQTAVNSLVLGVVTSSTWSFGLDRVIVDNASEPAGLATATTGTAASSAPAATQEATGAVTVPEFTGTAASTAPASTSSATGTSTAPGITGTASSTAPSAAQSATGTSAPPSFTGAASSAAPAATQQVIGTHTAPAFTGTAASTAPTATQAATGSSALPSSTGTISSSAPAATISVTAEFTPLPLVATVASSAPAATTSSTGATTVPEFTGEVTSSAPAAVTTVEGTRTVPAFVGIVTSSAPSAQCVVVGDSLDLPFDPTPTPPERTFPAPTRARVLTVSARTRTATVPARTRTIERT